MARAYSPASRAMFIFQSSRLVGPKASRLNPAPSAGSSRVSASAWAAARWGAAVVGASVDSRPQGGGQVQLAEHLPDPGISRRGLQVGQRPVGYPVGRGRGFRGHGQGVGEAGCADPGWVLGVFGGADRQAGGGQGVVAVAEAVQAYLGLVGAARQGETASGCGVS
jgi:hypothetical protein